MKFVNHTLFLLLLFISFDLKSWFEQEPRWDWDKINITDVSFTGSFLWGTADSALQTEGIISANDKLAQNSWTAWEEQEIIVDGNKQPRIPVEKRAGKGCERWTRYKDDIVQLLKPIGIKAHRFSLDWSKIEPEKGVFDHEAMQHYLDYTLELINNNIIPIPTLFHHAWPLWFNYEGSQDRNPAFEDEQNIQDFVEFSLYVLNAFKEAGLLNHVRLWFTINEPIGYAFAGYFYSLCPPGKSFNFKTTAIVAKNMLDAHIAVYDAFKKIDPTLKIGFAHIMQPIHAYRTWNPLDQIPARIFDYLVNDIALDYFKTGDFKWFWALRTHNPNAIGKVDVIGVNYYTHTVINMFRERPRPDEKIAEGFNGRKGKTVYPEGLYSSLEKASELGVPILITENGFATDNDALRDEYIKKHIYVLYKALADGMNIIGYLFWTLTDCYGWNRTNSHKHGIYKVDFETQERTLKPNAQYLIDIIKNNPTDDNWILAT